jgi:autotransporter-associated beta strand protein
VASLSPAGITTDNTGIGSSFSTELGNTSYLGLDGTFANRGAVSNFLATFGPSMGAANFAGTLGFDSFVKVVTPGSTNTFDDPIDVSPFSGEYFLGLGTESTAILGPDAVITPANETYMFGGGGGTLTVLSPLTDDGSTPRSLLMTTTPSPLTLLVNGTADYTGGTVSNGGVLIFENEVPLVGSIKNFAGYVGYTEAVTNIANAQQFVNLFDVNSSNSVIGFDAVDSNIGRTVSDDINLTAFTGLSAPFLGTSTNVTLSGMITPANGTYQFAAVKGGRLTVASNLTVTSAGAVIGLVNPIENLGTNSVVTMTGTNTYGGGTVFNSGTLFIDNDSALGAATGTLSVPNGTGLSTGSTSLFTPYLAPYGGGTITLAMPITVAPFQNGPGIQLGNIDGGTMLTLTGAITDYPGTHGGIAINGPVTITSSGNTYSGGTVFEGGSYSALTLTPNATLGCGNISTQVSGSIIPSGGNVTITNGILINGNTLTLGSNLNPNLLTLGTVLGGGGAISGYGTLDIESDVTLNSASSYDGTVSVNNAMVTLGNLTALGTGPVGLNSSTLTYGTGNPELLNLTGDQFSTINLASGATLTLDSETSGFPPTYSGAISGDATTTVIKTGAGGEDLNGTATYGGGTTIAQGTLVVGSNQAIGSGPALVQSSGVLIADDLVVLTNAVTVNSGGGLGGGGTFSPPGGVVFASGAILQPGSPLLGRAVETLNFGTAVTFGAGGVYQFVVEDAGGSPGTGFSSVNLAAPLTISATSGSQFTVQVSAIDSPYGDVGPAANFNASQPYSWTLLTAPSISGFSSTAFFVDSSLFAAQNPLLGGSFAIDEVNGNTLTLDFTPVPEPSTWILLGCGVGLVGFGSWRRLRSSAVRA